MPHSRGDGRRGGDNRRRWRGSRQRFATRGLGADGGVQPASVETAMAAVKAKAMSLAAASW